MNKCGLYLRKSVQLFTNNDYEKFEKYKFYNYNEIALLSIGIWNGHSCYTATERIHELANKANKFIKKMRNNGSHIIHCGSYSNYHCKQGNWEDTHLRKNIKGHKMAVLKDKGIIVPPIPIDDSDGGFEKEDKNMEYNKKEVSIHPSIEIDYEYDCISAYSKEILNYLYAKNIKCILVFGTHTNMCVLDKPYGIKWYIRYGFPTICVRDLCDSLYNPKMPPYISQEKSNIVMSEWLEKYICPTINEILDLNNKTYFVDIDKTITEGDTYENCLPKLKVIEKLNNLYDNGCNVIYWTARGTISGNDWTEFTEKQLKEWGVKYTILRTKKPFFDKFIEDKSINLDLPQGIKELMNL